MSYEFKQTAPNPHFPQVYDVEPQEVLENYTNLVLIDVRRPEEFVGELGHIKNSELIVLDTLPEKMNSLPKDKTIVFVCRSGARSAQASAYAQMNGLEHTYNMRGGMILWNHLQLPIEKQTAFN